METEKILWRSFEKCFDGNASDEERAQLERLTAESEENRAIVEQLSTLFFAAETLAVMRNMDTEAAKRKFHRRIAARRRNMFFSYLARTAALLFIPLLAATLMLLCGERSGEEVQMVELRTVAGMVSKITLPDQTQVWLNSGSVLSYPSRFGSERSVTLSGQAYFKVAKDAAHPFNVDAEGVRITVTGTEFDVDAYADRDGSVRTILVEGGIDLQYTGADKCTHTVSLHPGQLASVDNRTGALSIQAVNSASLVSWHDGRIVLEHTSFSDALRMIENRFNVRFDVRNPSLYEHNFTGVFTDQRLDAILNHFELSSRMKFRRCERVGDRMSEERETIEVY